jgi:hypothetical protein
MPHIPYAAVQTERHGLRSEIAERLREHYRERVQRRLVQRYEPNTADQRRDQDASDTVSQTVEQLRQRAREAWLRMRREMVAAPQSTEQLEQALNDKDLSL